jgi:hypothetical protein
MLSPENGRRTWLGVAQTQVWRRKATYDRKNDISMFYRAHCGFLGKLVPALND